MESRFEVDTSLGQVWFWGRDTGRPILLVISGAFATPDFFWKIQTAFPDADVLRTHLPGNHCPALSEISIAAFVQALDEALAARWDHRPLMAFGSSVGGIVALGLRHPGVRRVVTIEPPLLTDGVWPLLQFRSETPPGGGAFVWNIFGIGPDTVEARDHAWVLDGLPAPCLAIVGGAPLNPPRPFPGMPSLISDATLARLAAHPLVTVETIAEAGHNVARDANGPLHRLVGGWWNAAFPDAAIVL